jgi:hypothetical protein
MKNQLLLGILAAFAAGMNLNAQELSGREETGNRDFILPRTLAPAPAEASGGGGGVGDEAAQNAELVKKTLNPVADLISVPIQNNWDFGIGSADAMKYTVNVQPVVPVPLSKDWNLIVRTIMPIIYAESPVAGGSAKSGLGDILQSFFLSPKEPVGGWILGAGPALLYPSATDNALGSGKWGAGPTAVLLRQEHGWTYGILANHVWSYAGWGSQEVNATYLQPFFGYSTKTYTTFMVNTESTYDWHEQQWTVPLNFMITQLLKVGKQPISLQLGYRYYADKTSGGPDWGLRFAVTLLFPK